ncbi:HPr family phosphocarrier protein [Gorillibacterium massiliense]|uniref:HPr family phosphocarrier protein n=1 Tax=Gorillibacterium massiliense TaxID=1280390 RepID=UPI0004B5E002|nr:HPr family phosphocarrier protein [Gorillibacterium massiliense]
MQQKDFIIQNPNGIHTRPARKIVTASSAYPCEVFLEKSGKRFSAKRLLSVLSVNGKQGDAITVVTEGEQEQEALNEIGTILELVWDEAPAGE